MKNVIKQRCYIAIDKEGTKRYYVNKVLHREEGPAIEWSDGTKYWYKNGHLHREDGPAVETASVSEYWFKNGQCHREDGPAIKYYNGYKEWYLNNKYYGLNNDFTNKSWKRFIKTLIFS